MNQNYNTNPVQTVSTNILGKYEPQRTTSYHTQNLVNAQAGGYTGTGTRVSTTYPTTSTGVVKTTSGRIISTGATSNYFPQKEVLNAQRVSTTNNYPVMNKYPASSPSRNCKK